jgi:hypothetical protein
VTFFFAVLRDKLNGGQLLAQLAHAAREAPFVRPTEDERATILVGTKERMLKFKAGLDTLGYAYKAIVETDGQMAGSLTSIGVAVAGEPARASLEQLSNYCELTLWKKAPMSAEAVRQWLQNLPNDTERFKFILEALR